MVEFFGHFLIGVMEVIDLRGRVSRSSSLGCLGRIVVSGI